MQAEGAAMFLSSHSCHSDLFKHGKELGANWDAFASPDPSMNDPMLTQLTITEHHRTT